MANSLSVLELIKRYSRLDEKLNVCFVEDINLLSLDSNCLIMEDSEVDEQLLNNNLCIGLDAVSDVFDNLDQQQSNHSKEEALEALKFYLINDAFIELDSFRPQKEKKHLNAEFLHHSRTN